MSKHEHVPTGETRDIRVIGETPRNLAGFFIRVSIVQFGHGGMRVRLRMFQGSEFKRHLDLTTELARDLLPLLREASDLGKR